MVTYHCYVVTKIFKLNIKKLNLNIENQKVKNKK